MKSRHDPRANAILLLASTVLALPAGRVEAAVKYDLAAEGGVTAANNPLLIAGGELPALVTQASIEPGVSWTGATGSSLALDGVLTARSYSQRYGSFLLGQARAEGLLRRDERLTARASLGFDRDISADILAATVDAIIDPRSTRNAWDATTSLAWMPTARTTITPRLQFTSTRFANTDTLDTSKVYTAEIRVAHRLSEHTAIGVAAFVNRSDVSDASRYLTLSLLATLDRQFSPTVHLTTELGIERVRDRLTGTDRTNFSGRSQLCAKGERNSACLDASLASQVNALGTLQQRLAIGARLQRAIGPYWNIGLAADYQRASQRGVAAAPTLSAATARASIDWRFAKAVTLGGKLEYRQRDLGIGSVLDSGYAGVSLRWQR